MKPSRARAATPHPSVASLAVLALCCLPATLRAQVDALKGARWRSEEVGVGVVWKHAHVDGLFGAKQNLNVVEIDLAADPKPRMRIAAATGKKRTSALGRASAAVAAINGGYFDTKNGNPVGVLKVDGKLVHDDDAKRYVAIAFAEDGRPSILARPHDEHTKVRDALAAGPPLLAGGEPASHEGWQSMAKVRHPRSAIGITAARNLLCLTVDGRTPESAGMTCEELAIVMKQLGCVAAINLDGGGSTTLWVRGEPHEGVVSCPCDDRAFDHLGERAVANALLVEAADVVVVDDDDAALTPEAGFQRVADAKAQLTGYRVFAGDGAASATWRIEGMLPGRYRAFATWPVKPGRPLLEVAGRGFEPGDPAKLGAWVAIGEVELGENEAVRWSLVPGGAGPLVVDALKLVQIGARR
jgi:hypothetical protein